jgi:hypothetical protein
MGRIVPDGFLTISQALDRLVAGMYSGVPDRPVVKDLKARGSDVADGFAREAANERLWDAVDRAVTLASRGADRDYASLGVPSLFSFLRSPDECSEIWGRS